MAKIIIPGMIWPSKYDHTSARNSPELVTIAERQRVAALKLSEQYKEEKRRAALPPLTFADHLYGEQK